MAQAEIDSVRDVTTSVDRIHLEIQGEVKRANRLDEKNSPGGNNLLTPAIYSKVARGLSNILEPVRKASNKGSTLMVLVGGMQPAIERAFQEKDPEELIGLLRLLACKLSAYKTRLAERPSKDPFEHSSLVKTLASTIRLISRVEGWRVPYTTTKRFWEILSRNLLTWKHQAKMHQETLQLLEHALPAFNSSISRDNIILFSDLLSEFSRCLSSKTEEKQNNHTPPKSSRSVSNQNPMYYTIPSPASSARDGATRAKDSNEAEDGISVPDSVKLSPEHNQRGKSTSEDNQAQSQSQPQPEPERNQESDQKQAPKVISTSRRGQLEEHSNEASTLTHVDSNSLTNSNVDGGENGGNGELKETKIPPGIGDSDAALLESEPFTEMAMVNNDAAWSPKEKEHYSSIKEDDPPLQEGTLTVKSEHKLSLPINFTNMKDREEGEKRPDRPGDSATGTKPGIQSEVMSPPDKEGRSRSSLKMSAKLYARKLLAVRGSLPVLDLALVGPKGNSRPSSPANISPTKDRSARFSQSPNTARLSPRNRRRDSINTSASLYARKIYQQNSLASGATQSLRNKQSKSHDTRKELGRNISLPAMPNGATLSMSSLRAQTRNPSDRQDRCLTPPSLVSKRRMSVAELMNSKPALPRPRSRRINSWNTSMYAKMLARHHVLHENFGDAEGKGKGKSANASSPNLVESNSS
uniref:Uncharacterized protein n=1 Tax=Amorphochlora amoebiformis TaxID=1561963 RepID=A0A7S0DLU0_9EUKA|mmetsp:Transcript_33825/g.54471  ORF Transcript_33825/g.54471 Transcript_33825/m.54471 type:complete len:695 (+) Transcript_33825:114-2198(+)